MSKFQAEFEYRPETIDKGNLRNLLMLLEQFGATVSFLETPLNTWMLLSSLGTPQFGVPGQPAAAALTPLAMPDTWAPPAGGLFPTPPQPAPAAQPQGGLFPTPSQPAAGAVPPVTPPATPPARRTGRKSNAEKAAEAAAKGAAAGPAPQPAWPLPTAQPQPQTQQFAPPGVAAPPAAQPSFAPPPLAAQPPPASPAAAPPPANGAMTFEQFEYGIRQMNNVSPQRTYEVMSELGFTNIQSVPVEHYTAVLAEAQKRFQARS